MKILAVIPARIGSKGIKNKNRLKLCNKSLVEIAIEVAQKSKLITKLVFSSDDLTLIKKVKKKYKNVNVPFIRPKNLAGDKSSTYSVLKHAYKWFKNKEKWSADIIVLLQPTTPFRSSKIIDNVIGLLIKNKQADAAMTITDVEYPPHWMFLKKKKKLVPILKNGTKFIRRKDTPKVFKPAGLVYALKSNFLQTISGILPNKKTIGYYVDPNLCTNIDYYDQYLLSKIKIIKNKNLLSL